jgi:hypothetical protein
MALRHAERSTFNFEAHGAAKASAFGFDRIRHGSLARQTADLSAA